MPDSNYKKSSGQARSADRDRLQCPYCAEHVMLLKFTRKGKKEAIDVIEQHKVNATNGDAECPATGRTLAEAHRLYLMHVAISQARPGATFWPEMAPLSKNERFEVLQEVQRQVRAAEAA